MSVYNFRITDFVSIHFVFCIKTRIALNKNKRESKKY